jgi:hypothetical protein
MDPVRWVFIDAMAAVPPHLSAAELKDHSAGTAREDLSLSIEQVSNAIAEAPTRHNH